MFGVGKGTICLEGISAIHKNKVTHFLIHSILCKTEWRFLKLSDCIQRTPVSAQPENHQWVIPHWMISYGTQSGRMTKKNRTPPFYCFNDILNIGGNFSISNFYLKIATFPLKIAKIHKKSERKTIFTNRFSSRFSPSHIRKWQFLIGYLGHS